MPRKRKRQASETAQNDSGAVSNDAQKSVARISPFRTVGLGGLKASTADVLAPVRRHIYYQAARGLWTAQRYSDSIKHHEWYTSNGTPYHSFLAEKHCNYWSGCANEDIRFYIDNIDFAVCEAENILQVAKYESRFIRFLMCPELKFVDEHNNVVTVHLPREVRRIIWEQLA